MRNSESFMRMRTLQVIVLLIFALIVGRLAYIQLFDSRYDDLARANVLRHDILSLRSRGQAACRLQFVPFFEGILPITWSTTRR